MTDNIIKFPIVDTSDWVSASKLMTEYLLSSGMSPAECDEFLEFFKPTFESFDFDYDYKVTIPTDSEELEANVKEEIEAIISEFKAHNMRLLGDRFVRELQYFITSNP